MDTYTIQIRNQCGGCEDATFWHQQQHDRENTSVHTVTTHLTEAFCFHEKRHPTSLKLAESENSFPKSLHLQMKLAELGKIQKTLYGAPGHHHFALFLHSSASSDQQNWNSLLELPRGDYFRVRFLGAFLD